jgi:hypothetical protein
VKAWFESIPKFEIPKTHRKCLHDMGN